MTPRRQAPEASLIRSLLPHIITAIISAVIAAGGWAIAKASSDAAVQSVLVEHGRRLDSLEQAFKTDVVPRKEHEEKDRMLDTRLTLMQDELKQTGDKIDRIEQLLANRH